MSKSAIDLILAQAGEFRVQARNYDRQSVAHGVEISKLEKKADEERRRQTIAQRTAMSLRNQAQDLELAADRLRATV